MERGTPFALAHTFFQTGPFRPNNVDKKAPGLVFTGSSTLPGVGVPMVLVSGKLAAERVGQYASADADHAPLATLRRRRDGRNRRRRPPDAARRPGDARRELRAVPRVQQAPRHDVLLVDQGAAAVKRRHVHALYAFARYADDIVDEIPARVDATSRPRCGRRRSPTSATGSSPISTPAAPTTRCSRRSSTPCARSTSTRTRSDRFLRSMTMDLTVESYDTWDDLLVYMDGSAAVIGEMMLPILEPSDRRRGVAARPRPRQRVPADELPPRHRRRPRPRPPVHPARGLAPLRRRPGRPPGHARVRRADAIRDRSMPGAVPLGGDRHRDAARPVGEVRPGRPHAVRPDPRQDRGQGYDVFTSRATVSTTEKARVVASLIRR